MHPLSSSPLGSISPDEKARPNRRGPTPKLQLPVEHISSLLQAKKRVVMKMQEEFLDQAARTG